MHRRPELGHVLLPPPGGSGPPHAGHHRGVVHIKRRRALHDHIHPPLPFRSPNTSARRSSGASTIDRFCRAGSRHQSGVPEKAPTPDFARAHGHQKAERRPTIGATEHRPFSSAVGDRQVMTTLRERGHSVPTSSARRVAASEAPPASPATARSLGLVLGRRAAVAATRGAIGETPIGCNRPSSRPSGPIRPRGCRWRDAGGDFGA